MNPPAGSSYPEDWLRIARRDWQRVEMALSHSDAELAGFLLQQSLEKYLKAYMLARGSGLRRTHELDALLDSACRFDPQLARFRDLCERVSGYYLLERYPIATTATLSLDDLTKDIEEAREFVRALHPSESR